MIEHGERPWELRRGPFAEDEFSKLPERDWTLLVQAVDQFVPEVSELLEKLPLPAELARRRRDDQLCRPGWQRGSALR